MEERIRTIGKAAWWLLGITLVVALIGYVGYVIRVIFPPLVLAGIIVFLANPIVGALHRRGLPRVLGTAATYLAFFLTIGLVGVLVSPLVAQQFDDLSERFPKVREDFEDKIDEYHDRSVENDWIIKIPTVKQIQEEAGGGDEAKLSDQVTTLRKVATRAFHVGLIFILGPIVAFYLLIDLPDIRERIESMIPEDSRPRVVFIGHRLNRVIGGFFRGQLAVAFIVGVMVSIGLAAIGLPLWLIVGMIAGLFNIIPLIGPYIGAVPGIVIALTTRGLGTAVGVAVVMVVAQQIDNHFITPAVMRRAVHLHAAVVVLALLVFGTLGGFFGLLIAVPLTATGKVVGGHLWRRYAMGVSVPGLDEPMPSDDAPEEGDDGGGVIIAPG
ncbi:MAG: AI-2E family transporter [Acidimicrobiales bacterium]